MSKEIEMCAWPGCGKAPYSELRWSNDTIRVYGCECFFWNEKQPVYLDDWNEIQRRIAAELRKAFEAGWNLKQHRVDVGFDGIDEIAKENDFRDYLAGKPKQKCCN